MKAPEIGANEYVSKVRPRLRWYHYLLWLLILFPSPTSGGPYVFAGEAIGSFVIIWGIVALIRKSRFSGSAMEKRASLLMGMLIFIVGIYWAYQAVVQAFGSSSLNTAATAGGIAIITGLLGIALIGNGISEEMARRLGRRF